MTLVDELKAALPGWTVTGHDLDATARKEGTEACVRCAKWDRDIECGVWVGGWCISMTYRETVAEGLDVVRRGVARGLVRLAEQVTQGQAALNALGGGK